jgi:hypothetical protein
LEEQLKKYLYFRLFFHTQDDRGKEPSCSSRCGKRPPYSRSCCCSCRSRSRSRCILGASDSDASPSWSASWHSWCSASGSGTWHPSSYYSSSRSRHANDPPPCTVAFCSSCFTSSSCACGTNCDWWGSSHGFYSIHTCCHRSGAVHACCYSRSCCCSHLRGSRWSPHAWCSRIASHPGRNACTSGPWRASCPGLLLLSFSHVLILKPLHFPFFAN